MKFGAIKQQKLNSPLEQMATVRPTTNKMSMFEVATPLLLTSLVDAFAVIVIYLLVSTQQSQNDLKMDNKIKLPQASHSQALQPGVNVRITGKDYIVNDSTLKIEDLASYLNKLNQDFDTSNDMRKGKLIIQADKDSDFDGISPLLAVAAQTGFENVRFAVIGESN